MPDVLHLHFFSLVSVMIFHTFPRELVQCAYLRSVYDLMAFTWANDFIAIRESCSDVPVQCTHLYMHYKCSGPTSCSIFVPQNFMNVMHFAYSTYFSFPCNSLHSPDEEMVDAVRFLYRWQLYDLLKNDHALTKVSCKRIWQSSTKFCMHCTQMM